MATRRARPRPRRDTPTAHQISDIADALDGYLAAWRWRRVVEAALRSLELTFTQWLVLDTTTRAIVAAGGPVSQSDVARACELDRMTISQVMKTLAEQGLVDRGSSAVGPAYRIILTRRGRQIVQQAETRVAAATARGKEVSHD